MKKFFNLLAAFLLITTPVLADHVPTQEPYGYEQSINPETGDLTIRLLGSDGFEDSPPEKYTIFFGMATGIDTNSFCISTSFGHVQNQWSDHVFSISNLRTYFELPVGTFYYRVRSDNDTDSSYSTISIERSIALPDQTPFNETQTDWSLPSETCNDTSTPPPTPNNAINVSVNYQGEDVFFEWEYADGDVDAHSFHINYSYDNTNFTRVIIDDTSLREYTLDSEYIETGTFYWSFSVCGDLDNGESCTESDANNFETTEYTPPTTTPPTTQAPAPPPEPPEPYVDPYVKEDKEVIMDDGSVGTYSQSDIDDGTVERDNERKTNEELYGCYITNVALERGDCDTPEEIIIIVDEEYEEEIYEEEYDTNGEFPDDDIVVLELEDEYEDEKFIELTEEEILEIEKQMELEVELLEREEEFEIYEFETKEEAEEFLEAILEVEEYLEEVEEIEIIEVEILDIPEDIVIIIEEEVEEIKDELVEEIYRDDTDTEDEIQTEEILDESIQEDVEEEVVEVFNFFEDEEVIELTEEELEEEVAEIEEIIVLDIPEVTEKEIEEYTEEELEEYEEVKEAIIQEYVQELETEEVIEVIEEVNDIGVQNLEQVSVEVQEIVQAVVEEAIDDIEILTEEQVEVVAEVLQVQTEDVEIIAEAVQEDEVVAEAVEEYVERAVENADVENYTLADVVTEVQYENFLENPIETFVDLDFEAIEIGNIGDDMTQDQREKAQEVVVPVILTRIASMAAFMFRRSL